jgi:hypothetical protein
VVAILEPSLATVDIIVPAIHSLIGYGRELREAIPHRTD